MKRQLQFLIYRSAGEDISAHAPGRKQQLFVYVKANLAVLDFAQDAVGHIPQNSGS